MYIIITGATGTKKSSTAVELALMIKGEIISADSMQVYNGMDIGTSKIKKLEMKNIPHHLIDVVQPGSPFSAAQYKAIAEKTMDEIKSRGNIPIITGGTGLYVSAITRGLMIAKEPSAELKALLRVEYEENGLELLVNKLNKLDNGAAAMIDINNSRRVLRALELIIANKSSLKEIRSTTEVTRYKDDYKMFILEKEREEMYFALDSRVDDMIQEGLVNEVKMLMDKGVKQTDNAMQAIGYKETAQYLNNIFSERELKNKIKQATRNYAKRQLTWMKKYSEATKVQMSNKTPKQAADEIYTSIMIQS